MPLQRQRMPWVADCPSLEVPAPKGDADCSLTEERRAGHVFLPWGWRPSPAARGRSSPNRYAAGSTPPARRLRRDCLSHVPQQLDPTCKLPTLCPETTDSPRSPVSCRTGSRSLGYSNAAERAVEPYYCETAGGD